MIDEIVNKYLNESSLARIYQYVEDKGKKFGIMSSFRKNFTRSENMERHKQLQQKLRNMGYGFIELDGAYPEGGKVAMEKSLFIPNITKKEIVELGVEYEQDSVMFKDKDQFVYIGTNEYSGIGKITSKFVYGSGRENIQDGLSDLFSALTKGSHKGKKFLFNMKED